MWLFLRRKNCKRGDAKAIHDETMRNMDKAIDVTARLSKEGGTTQLIFLATGGDKRVKK